MKSYYVYILGNGKGFSAKYGLNQLLFFDEFDNIYDALDAEKKIKGWLRKKKLALMRTKNPKFEDLSKDWYDS